MLPESKTSFPKLLYLDQNKWIDLSRAHYGHLKGEPFRDALAAVRKAISDGKLIVPFPYVHVTEIRADRDGERRKRLARFMVDLSSNLSILPFMAIRSWEVRNATHSLFGRTTPGRIRASIVREGFANSLALRLDPTELPPEVEASIMQEVNSPQNTIDFLIESGEDDESERQFKADEAYALAFQEKVRSNCANDGVTWDRRWMAELKEHFLLGDVGKAVEASLQEIGFPFSAFWANLPNESAFKQFLANVSTLDVMIALTLTRDRDLLRPIHKNDARDLIWLSVAIPYSNIVVSENHWGHLVQTSRLDSKYGTKVITDTKELPVALIELGCL